MTGRTRHGCKDNRLARTACFALQIVRSAPSQVQAGTAEPEHQNRYLLQHIGKYCCLLLHGQIYTTAKPDSSRRTAGEGRVHSRTNEAAVQSNSANTTHSTRGYSAGRRSSGDMYSCTKLLRNHLRSKTEHIFFCAAVGSSTWSKLPLWNIVLLGPRRVLGPGVALPLA